MGATLCRWALLLASTALGGLVGRRLEPFGVPGATARCALAGAALVGLAGGVAAWLAAPRGEPDSAAREGSAWTVFGWLGLLVAGLTLVLPAGRVAGWLTVLSPQSFPTSGGVPEAACRLFLAELAWGAVILATLVSGIVRVATAGGKPTFSRLFVGLLTLHLVLASWVSLVQSLTGDEPHYLLMTRSLLADRDLVLENDYTDRLYRDFYPSDLLRRTLGLAPELDPHAVPGRRGELRPVHQAGLAVLLAPGYAVAGWRGAVATAALLGALAGWLTFRLALATAGEPRWGWLAGAAVTLCSPLFAYGASLHSEPAAAVCLLVLALTMVGLPLAGGKWEWAPATAAALALPWLHVKYILPGALFAYWLWADGRREGRSRAGWPAAGLAAGVLALLASFAWMYGTPWPNAPQLRGAGRFPSLFSGNPLVGIPGLLVDQQDGLFSAWPLGLLVVPGLALCRDRARARLATVVGLHVALLATYRLWGAGHAPAGRQLVPVLGLLAPFVADGAAWLWDRRPSLLRLVALVNSVWVALLAWLPRLRYPVDLEGVPHAPLLARLHAPALDLLLPVVRQGGPAVWVGWAYVAAAVSWALAVRREVTGHAASIDSAREGSDG